MRQLKDPAVCARTTSRAGAAHQNQTRLSFLFCSKVAERVAMVPECYLNRKDQESKSQGDEYLHRTISLYFDNFLSTVPGSVVCASEG